ncbi:MAG: 4'-phosphopantetheinyl transferase superfamily protein [Planctomycetota bacterium]
MTPELVLLDALPPGPLLSAAAAARAAALPSEVRRRAWTLARAAGKLAVEGLLAREGRSAPPRPTIELPTAASGAPQVRGVPGEVALSLTHGHGAAGAYALRPGAAGGLPGVDLERARPRPDASLDLFLHPNEASRIRAEAPGEGGVGPRDRLAVLAWALKEAGFKALHLPPGLGLLQVELELPAAWSAATGAARLGYRGEAAAQHRRLGGGPVAAGWRWLDDARVLAWVTVAGATLPR